MLDARLVLRLGTFDRGDGGCADVGVSESMLFIAMGLDLLGTAGGGGGGGGCIESWLLL